MMALTLGDAYNPAEVQPMCGCTSLSHNDVRRLIKAKGLKTIPEVMQQLEWTSSGGCHKCRPALNYYLVADWPNEYADDYQSRFINERVHANIQKDGTFSVVPQIPGGITSPAQLRRIADVAERYHVPLVKLTGGQRIDLLGVRKDDLPKVWEDLGMPSGYAYGKSYRTCKSCVGSDFCRFGLGDSITLAGKIEQEFQGFDSPHKLKLATAGCPRNCSEAMVKDLGAVAVEGGKWEIYIGGAAGSSVRKGDILCVVDSHEDVLKYMGRFIQYYRENAKYLERTHGFVQRLGIEKLRAIVMEDSEGIAERLDREIAESKAAYKDPWQEIYMTAAAKQFEPLLPVLS
jgi:nitrite reductase (NADH) large subunit